MPLGPLVAGWLLTHFAWGSIFLINAPVVTVAAAGVACLVPASKDPAAGRVDWPGALLAAAGVGGLVYGVIEQPAYGWHGTVLAGLIGGAGLLAAFAAWQRRARSPLVPLRLLRNQGFSWGSIAFAVNGFALSGVLFVLAQYLQIVQGSDAAGTGLRLLPMIGAMLAGAAVSEKMLAPRLGGRALIPAGMLVSVAGLAVLTFVRAGSGYGVVALGLAVFGAGLGVSLPLSVDTVLASLPPGQTGVGNAMSRTLQSIAGALGTAIVGSVLNAAYRERLAGAVDALPGRARAAATASVAGAHAVAGRLPAGAGRVLTGAANQAYAHGMTEAVIVSAIVLAVAGLAVRLCLPRRRRPRTRRTGAAGSAAGSRGRARRSGSPAGRTRPRGAPWRRHAAAGFRAVRPGSRAPGPASRCTGRSRR
jgi:MFS transporter, DHA2 family, multidrug resistance protein